MATKEIIEELNLLESKLTAGIAQPVSGVPDGYFDGFAGSVLDRIKSMEASNAKEELSHLSTVLGTVSGELPYSVPTGYFDTLGGNILAAIRAQESNQTAAEELAVISPLLSGIGKKMPYNVPAGYFDSLAESIGLHKKIEAKVVPMNNRRWLRYAAAAVMTGVIVLAGFLFFDKGKSVDVSNTHAWVEKNMNKVSTSDINTFIQQNDGQHQAISASFRTADIQDMLKDVSDNDLQNFLTETEAVEEYNDELYLN